MKTNGFTVVEATVALLVLAAVLACGAGYVMNFENIITYAAPTKPFILSLVGVFFVPLGIFTGFYY